MHGQGPAVGHWRSSGLVILGSIVGPQGSNPKDTYSVGRLTPGECMSGDRYNSLAGTVMGNTDWSKVQGAATFSASTKSLIGGITVSRRWHGSARGHARTGCRFATSISPRRPRSQGRWLLALCQEYQPRQHSNALPLQPETTEIRTAGFNAPTPALRLF
jgi:hypothetical protein